MATFFANLGNDKISNNIAAARDTVGVPFSVGNLMGCVLWLSADQNVYSDNGITPATDGGSVYYWGDRSGRGNHATNATLSTEPTYNTNELNGLPTISFASDFLTCANPTDFDIAHPTVILVGKWTSGSFCGKGSAAETDVKHRKLQLNVQGGGSLIAFWAGTDAMSGCAANTTASNWTLYSVLSYRHNYTEWFVNGVKTIQTASINNAVINSSAFTLGCAFPGNVEPGTVEIAEIIVFNRILTPSQLDNVQDYLSEKWGIAVS